MNRQSLLIATALLLLTLLGFTVFPGHTWLQSDTQIYTPILDRIQDPTLFARDEIALQPHVKWTLYDESAIMLSRLTGLGFREVLEGQQLVFRLLGLLGAFLLARAFGLNRMGSLLVAGCFGLGAIVNGPAVLTFEYEPVPRGFAVMLLTASLGFAAHRRLWCAGLLAGIATLYHPTTCAPFWACALIYWVMSKDRREMLPLFAPLVAASCLVLAGALLQHGAVEKQVWFGRIDPELERIQRLRGPYNWISQWPAEWFWQYPLLLGFVALAWRRLRDVMSPEARFFTLALPVYGLLMVPVQYALLDVGKWILMPQAQPARAVLFITEMAVLLGAAAGWRAASQGRWTESGAWFFVVFAIPANGLVLQLLSDGNWRRIVLVAALTATAVLAAKWRWAVPAVLAAAIFLIPGWGGIQNYPPLHTRELDQLAAWARNNTSNQDVFQFADTQHGLQPGVFRANSQRNVFVDWKAGGQANLVKGFGEEWWRRWQLVNQAKAPIRALGDYRALGIDYLVVRPSNCPPGAAIAFQNKDWAVLDLRLAR